jgi:hypothetical protein
MNQRPAGSIQHLVSQSRWPLYNGAITASTPPYAAPSRSSPLSDGYLTLQVAMDVTAAILPKLEGHFIYLSVTKQVHSTLLPMTLFSIAVRFL